MSDFNAEDIDGEDVSAGEYALGVLDGAERRAAETRLAREPAFALQVEAWQARLCPMAETIAPVTPPTTAWPRIERALGRGNVKVVDLAQRRAVAFWRSWAIAATAAAAAALVVLAVKPAALLTPAAPPTPAPASQPVLVAELTDKTGHGFMTVTYDQTKGELHIAPSVALPVSHDRAAELWLIAADGVPRSLGVVDPAKPTAVRVAEPLRPGAKPASVLAITVEPPGGSPTGKPTTKPIWTGKLAEA